MDPWDLAIRDDPHAYWAHLRRDGPAPRFPGPVTGNTFVFLTRDDHFAALRSRGLDWNPGFFLRGARSLPVRRAA